MVKLVVLYTKPADPEAFDQHYREVHIPLVQKLPRMRRAEVAWFVGESPYYLMCEMYWDSREDMDADSATDEMRATRKDARAFASGLFSTHVAEVRDDA